MSEASSTDDNSSAHYRRARLRFVPNDELNERLERFLNERILSNVGRRGLFLYSDGYIQTPNTHNLRAMGHDLSQADVEAVQEVARINLALKDRNRSPRNLAPFSRFKKLPDRYPGLVIQLKVVMDDMTARILKNTVFLDEGKKVLSHVEVKQAEMAPTKDLTAAAIDLQEALQDKDLRLGTAYMSLDDPVIVL